MIRSENKIVIAVEAMMKDTVEASRLLDHSPKQEARCSSLSSFCQVAFMIPYIEESLEGEYFTKDFYCEIGTAVHSSLQKWFGFKKHLYGRWKCQKCKKIIKEGFGPVMHHNNLCIYEEYDLSWKDLTGHCDGIIIVDKKCYILEFKTTSLEGLRYRIKANEPYDYHGNQVNMYVLMGQKLKLPYPLVGAVIVYIARDNPKKYAAFLQEGVSFENVKEVLQQYKEATKMLTKGVFTNVIKKCKKFNEAPFCAYKSMCFQGDIEKILKKHWDLYNG